MTLQPSGMAWYGESTNRTKQQFFERASAIKLDTLTWENSAEPLSERFWRRYRANAMELPEIVPDQFGASPIMARRMVDFPDPLSPTNPKLAPRSTLKLA